MAEDDNTPPDEIDLEELVGNVLDARGLTKERLSLIDGLGAKLDALVTAGNSGGSQGGSTPAPFDEAGFMDRVSAAIDEKIAAATASGKKVPPLSRWLGLAGSTE